MPCQVSSLQNMRDRFKGGKPFSPPSIFEQPSKYTSWIALMDIPNVAVLIKKNIQNMYWYTCIDQTRDAVVLSFNGFVN